VAVLAAAVPGWAVERAALRCAPGWVAGREHAVARCWTLERRRGTAAGEDRGGQEQPSRRRRPRVSSLRRWSWRGGAAAGYHDRNDDWS
jgi:hypothetical protein